MRTRSFVPPSRQRRSAILGVLTIIAVMQCFGGSQDSTETPGLTIQRDALSACGAAWHLVGAPLRWGATDWCVAGGVAIGTGISSLADNGVRTAMGRNHTATNDRIESIGVAYGDGAYALSAAGGAYIAGLLFKDQWLRETALLACEAMVFSGALSTVTKIVVGRARPYTDLGHGKFTPFRYNEDRNSFPSGHTVIAFSLSTVLARRINNPLASVLLYGIAGTTAVARMYGDYHWLSDVVFGGALSVAVASSVVSWHDDGEAMGESGLHIVPSSSGVALVWTF